MTGDSNGDDPKTTVADLMLHGLTEEEAIAQVVEREASEADARRANQPVGVCAECGGPLASDAEWPRGTTPGKVCHQCKIRPSHPGDKSYADTHSDDSFIPGPEAELVAYEGTLFKLGGPDNQEDAQIEIELQRAIDRFGLWSLSANRWRKNKSTGLIASFINDGEPCHPLSDVAWQIGIVVNAVAESVLNRIAGELLLGEADFERAERAVGKRPRRVCTLEIDREDKSKGICGRPATGRCSRSLFREDHRCSEHRWDSKL